MQTRPDNVAVCVSALYAGGDCGDNEVQVLVISTLESQCVVIGERWSLACL